MHSFHLSAKSYINLFIFHEAFIESLFTMCLKYGLDIKNAVISVLQKVNK